MGLDLKKVTCKRYYIYKSASLLIAPSEGDGINSEDCPMSYREKEKC